MVVFRFKITGLPTEKKINDFNKTFICSGRERIRIFYAQRVKYSYS